MKCCADVLRRALDALRRGYWAFADALRFVVRELRRGFWAAVHVLRRALDAVRRGYWAFADVLRWMLRAVRGAGGARAAGGGVMADGVRVLPLSAAAARDVVKLCGARGGGL